VVGFNPYEPPSDLPSVGSQSGEGVRIQLASPWVRLGAGSVDAAITLVLLMSIQYALGVFDNPRSAGQQALRAQGHWTLVGFILWLMVHGVFIARSSQTLGKRLFKLQVVDVNTAARASFAKIVLRRQLPLSFVSVR
jgi:uncharacterized RDD family membrane protein YckC